MIDKMLNSSYGFVVVVVLSMQSFIITTAIAGQHAHLDENPTFEEMQSIVKVASAPATVWDGPVSGPPGKPSQYIAIVCEDLKNGGILHVAQGIQEAAVSIGWKVLVYDAEGSSSGRVHAFADAMKSEPDGIALVGADAAVLDAELEKARTQGIPVVGWHVGSVPGRLAGGPVAMNISTDPVEVARITAMAAITSSQGKAGVVIFTDSNFAIAMEKANTMAKTIQACSGCELLDMLDVAISDSANTVPEVVRSQRAKYGDRWTHALAINDIYFDYAVPEFILDDLKPDKMHLLSAGDGSNAAFLRIQTGTFQTHTVAEPLNLHGWQMIDELNRLISGEDVTGYIAPLHLVTHDNAWSDGGANYLYDPSNGYRDVYRNIWGHKQQ